MNHASIVDGLLDGYDLSREAERRKAYVACQEYANEHMQARAEYNHFMQIVGDRLQMPPVRMNRLDGDEVEVPENAKIHLKYSPRSGPELTGNADGLRYVASILEELAEQAEAGDHFHLYPDSFPMCGDGYPLTIYHEPGAWFERFGADGDAVSQDQEGPQESGIVERAIEPSEIAALCMLAEGPPDMPLTKHKLYAVVSVERYDGRDVWKMCIREDRRRLRLFTVRAGDGTGETFAFDLDDLQVLFFTRRDLSGLGIL
ncbi:MAG TPA: hypothetical protein PKH24_13545 [Sedimentisphaerales bacterium]|nr:hypothetical protein [Sedimentisphaerales bacterium]HNU29891.1 hypothetical protein [Sedimentisphaerales bacterium]